MKHWVVAAYDPRGIFVDTTGRRWLLRWFAERERQNYEEQTAQRGFHVVYQGESMPLTRYVVERRD